MRPNPDEINSSSDGGGIGSLRHERQKSQNNSSISGGVHPSNNHRTEPTRGKRKIPINPPQKIDALSIFPSNRIADLSDLWYCAYFLLLWDQAFRVPYALSLLGIIVAAAIPTASRESDYRKLVCCEMSWAPLSTALSSNGVIPRLIPVLLSMSLSAIIDYKISRRRARIIDTVNGRVYMAVDHLSSRVIAVPRSEIQVGQILRLKKYDEVPADCLVLSTSNPDGTMSIRNDPAHGLNTRRVAIRETKSEVSFQAIRNMCGEIQCDVPADGQKFSGVIRLKDHPRGASIDPRAWIRTGDIIEGCEWCFVIVAFTGLSLDTTRNYGGGYLRIYRSHKYSLFERQLNTCCLLLAGLSILSSFIVLLYRLGQQDPLTSAILPLAMGQGWRNEQNVWVLIGFHFVIAMDHTGLCMIVLLDITQFLISRLSERRVRHQYTSQLKCKSLVCDDGKSSATSSEPSPDSPFALSTEDQSPETSIDITEENNARDRNTAAQCGSRVSVSSLSVFPTLAAVDLILLEKKAAVDPHSPLVFECCAVGGKIYGLKSKRGRRRHRDIGDLMHAASKQPIQSAVGVHDTSPPNFSDAESESTANDEEQGSADQGEQGSGTRLPCLNGQTSGDLEFEEGMRSSTRWRRASQSLSSLRSWRLKKLRESQDLTVRDGYLPSDQRRVYIDPIYEKTPCLSSTEASKRSEVFCHVCPANMVNFDDISILNDLRVGGRKSFEIDLFLKALCVCNSVSIERNIWKPTHQDSKSQIDSGRINFSAAGVALVRDAFLQSPVYTSGRSFEVPAVLAAQKMGYQLYAKCKRWIALNINGQFVRFDRVYKSDVYLGGDATIVVLQVSKRRGVMFFKCGLKGMLNCLAAHSKSVHSRLRENDFNLNSFANKIISRGLIPVCIGYKLLTEREIRLLSRRMLTLANVVNDAKTQIVESINSELANGCTFLGIAAFREMLQPQVQNTISTLSEAAVRVWIVSCDWEEHVLAFSCGAGLTSPTTRLFRVQGDSRRLLLSQHKEFSRMAQDKPINSQLALIVSGPELERILSIDTANRGMEIILLSMAWRADVVIFHSLTGSQKGSIPRTLRRHLRPWPVVLAVGADLSDVSMLQEATVSVSLASSRAHTAEDLHHRQVPYEGHFDSRLYADAILPSIETLKTAMFYHGHRAHFLCSLVLHLTFIASVFGLLTSLVYLVLRGNYDSLPLKRLIQCILCLQPFVLLLDPQELSKAALESLPVAYTLTRRTSRVRINCILVDLIYGALVSLITCVSVNQAIKGGLSFTIDGTSRSSALDLLFLVDMCLMISLGVYAVYMTGPGVRTNLKTWALVVGFIMLAITVVSFTSTSQVLISDYYSMEEQPYSTYFRSLSYFALFAALTSLFAVMAYLIQTANMLPTTALRDFLVKTTNQHKYSSHFAARLRKLRRLASPSSTEATTVTSSSELYGKSKEETHEYKVLHHLHLILNPLQIPRLLALLPQPKRYCLHYKQSNGSKTTVKLPPTLPLDVASVNLQTNPGGDAIQLRQKRGQIDEEFTFSPYSLKVIRSSMKRSPRREPWILVESGIYEELIKSTNSANLNPTGSSSYDAAVPVIKRTVKPEDVTSVFDRRLLKFKDEQLEADYQLHRVEHIRRYRVSYRVIFLALSVICIATVIDEMFFITGDMSTVGAILLFLPYAVSLCISFACYNESQFAVRYDRLAGMFVIGLLIAQLLSDVFSHKDGSPTAAVYMVIIFIFFRLPFIHSLVYNCVHFFTFCLRFTLTAKLLEHKQSQTDPTTYESSFKLASSMENLTIRKLITYVPVLLGIEVFTGFAAYRLEYNRRKAYVLQYQVQKARKRQIEILHNMLPPFVVSEMIKGNLDCNGIPAGLKAEDRGTVSVMFLDVNDFQKIVTQIEPTHLVRILDSLFLCFDKCAEKYGCVKIETVFETFLAASGMDVEDQQGQHATTGVQQAALAALCMCILALQSCRHITWLPSDELRRSRRLHIRIGIHAGRVISGLVGAKKPQYALFGDTVNTASRMMSTGLCDHIHVSDAFYRLIANSEWELEWTTREIPVKGKGLMKTHLLDRSAIPDNFLDNKLKHLNRTRPQSSSAGGANGSAAHPASQTEKFYDRSAVSSESQCNMQEKGPDKSFGCFGRAIDEQQSQSQSGGPNELLFHQSIHFAFLKFKSTELEKAYLTHYYTNSDNVNNVEQALIIFLASYVAQTLVLLAVPRYDSTPSTAQKSITWTVRTCLTGFVLLLWLIIHHRNKFMIIKTGGIKWIIFFTNMVNLIAGSIVLLESAWMLDFPEGIPPVWLHLDTLQIFFFTTILHQNSGLLIQHLLIIDSFVNVLALSFIYVVCQRTNITYEAGFIIPVFTLANLVSVYFREYVDRHTYVVNELMKSAQARGLQLLRDNLPRQVFDELSNERLRLAYLHNRVTFIFADICGFTTWADTVDAGEVVRVLQSLFAKFDRDSSRFGVFKVCTIGDAYVAISEPTIEGDGSESSNALDPAEGAARIIALGQCMIKDIVQTREKLHIPTLDMRIGLHHGQCVGGVIGSGRLRYDIWGIDVLAGNLIESNGVPGRLCASQELVDFLEIRFPGQWRFSFHRRVQLAPGCYTNAFLLMDTPLPGILSSPHSRRKPATVAGSYPIPY